MKRVRTRSRSGNLSLVCQAEKGKPSTHQPVDGDELRAIALGYANGSDGVIYVQSTSFSVNVGR